MQKNAFGTKIEICCIVSGGAGLEGKVGKVCNPRNWHYKSCKTKGKGKDSWKGKGKGKEKDES